MNAATKPIPVMWMRCVATLKGLTTAPANLDTLEMERNALQLVCSIPTEFLWYCLQLFYAVYYGRVVQFTNILPKYLTISRRRRREYRRIVTSPEETNCLSIITLMIIRENKIKDRQMFERFWGFKMSVEGGSDRQQAGFLIIAAVGFPHENVKFCQTFI